MGSGFKTFDPGDVLTASDVNNFLMEQSVMSFADSAARTSAIGTANFEEGMVAYLQDTDKIQVYNGTAWVDAANNTGAGLIHINTTSFSGVASQSVNNVFSSTYDNYRILVNFSSFTGDNNELTIKFRAAGTDTSTNYLGQRIVANATTVIASANHRGTDEISIGFGDKDENFSATTIDVFSPNLAEITKLQSYSTSSNSSLFYISHQVGIQNTTTQFDGFTLIVSTGNMTGTVSTYGYRK